LEFYPINLFYFLLVVPIVLIGFSIASKLYKAKKSLALVINLSLLFFLVRLILVFFQVTIGIMPYLIEDILFYVMLMFLGIFMTWYYLRKIEMKSLKEIGGAIENFKRSIVLSLIGFLPLICLFPIMIFLADIQLNFVITGGKIIVAISFAVLGAFYEEVMFRGIIQNHISDLVENNIKTIILTALIFTSSHIFYLPIIGLGIFYIFVFIMALILSILRLKVDLLSCAILHGGIVFILIIFV
jgi:membrane protease YdiL (CAAX protease family)